MTNFIKALFNGDINPGDTQFCTDSEYRKILSNICEMQEKLMKPLSEDNLELFHSIMELHNELSCISTFENFKLGFILGVRMMVDCFGYEPY